MTMREICVCYGMTETSPVSTESCTDDPLELRVTTVGTVHPHVEIKIIDPETGAIVPRGTAGEFCTRGYSVMLGYWDNPEKNRAIIDNKRWLHTGDIAIMDENGYVSIVGRLKDLIIRGGEKTAAEMLDSYCRGQIATFKIPKYWKFVDSFPMTVTGKIRKGEMREIAEKEVKLK